MYGSSAVVRAGGRSGYALLVEMTRQAFGAGGCFAVVSLDLRFGAPPPLSLILIPAHVMGGVGGVGGGVGLASQSAVRGGVSSSALAQTVLARRCSAMRLRRSAPDDVRLRRRGGGGVMVCSLSVLCALPVFVGHGDPVKLDQRLQCTAGLVV